MITLNSNAAIYNINAKHLQGTNFLKTGYNISSKKFQKSKSRKKNQLRKTNKQTNSNNNNNKSKNKQKTQQN